MATLVTDQVVNEGPKSSPKLLLLKQILWIEHSLPQVVAEQLQQLQQLVGLPLSKVMVLKASLFLFCGTTGRLSGGGGNWQKFFAQPSDGFAARLSGLYSRRLPCNPLRVAKGVMAKMEWGGTSMDYPKVSLEHTLICSMVVSGSYTPIVPGDL